MPKFIRWDTPFSDSKFPSVGLLSYWESKCDDQLQAVVAPDGIDRYPKYLVTFTRVIAFTCLEEMLCPELYMGPKIIMEPGLSAYECLESPWLKSYTGVNSNFDPLHHYAIYGGDNNVEVVTQAVPTVETIGESRTTRLECRI